MSKEFWLKYNYWKSNSVIKSLAIRILIEPRDAWIGVYWKKTDRSVDVYVCILPFTPLYVTYRWCALNQSHWPGLAPWYKELETLAYVRHCPFLIATPEDHREAYEDGATPEDELWEQMSAAL